MLVYLVLNNRLFRYLGPRLSTVLYLYTIWCILTFLSSDIPTLTLLKSSLFFFIVFTLTGIGIEWVRWHGITNSLNYLKWLSFIIVFSSLAGLNNNYISPAADVKLYQGLSYNPNMLCSLLAMTFPFLIWKTYENWNNKKIRYIWFIITMISLYCAIKTGSRASGIVIILTLLGFLSSLNLSKKILFALSTGIILLSFFLINPFIVENFVIKHVFKGTPNNILYTRERVWLDSYQAAEQGGLFGLGQGISYRETNFRINDLTSNGLTSLGYGREKGNSQLSIIEETGLIGLFFYILFLLVVFRILWNLYFKAQGSDKVMIGIISGTFFGFLCQSVFEAWWTSPGSPESLYFWTLVGIIRGIEIVMNFKKNNILSDI